MGTPIKTIISKSASHFTTMIRNFASEDEDTPNTSPVPKRARTTDNTRGVEVEQNSRSQRNKGRGKGREDWSDEEDQKLEDHTDNINDEQFEERFHERIEKAVDAKRNVVGVSVFPYRATFI